MDQIGGKAGITTGSLPPPRASSTLLPRHHNRPFGGYPWAEHRKFVMDPDGVALPLPVPLGIVLPRRNRIDTTRRPRHH